jgi:hypothetical protein
MHRILVLLALHFFLTGCGNGPAPTAGLGFRNRTILTSEEIVQAGVSSQTAYELIYQLRPEYLRSRGRSSLRTMAPPTAVVYVNDMRFGDITSLNSISVEGIYMISYMSASDATTRFGSDHLAGAILITTK